MTILLDYVFYNCLILSLVLACFCYRCMFNRFTRLRLVDVCMGQSNKSLLVHAMAWSLQRRMLAYCRLWPQMKCSAIFVIKLVKYSDENAIANVQNKMPVSLFNLQHVNTYPYINVAVARIKIILECLRNLDILAAVRLGRLVFAIEHFHFLGSFASVFYS